MSTHKADGPSEPPADHIGNLFTTFLQSDAFTCVGGKAAAMRAGVVHRHYGVLGDTANTPALHSDLVNFVEHLDEISELFATFAATFDGPRDMSEHQYESLLWRQLQQLYECDRLTYPWAEGADSDPSSDRFRYSVAGHPFFIVGLHRNASRMTRRFEWPTLVFNSHQQFDKHRKLGTFPRMKRVIRKREMELQGSLNPRLIDFGYRPEAIRYAGRAVERGWTCPFHTAP